MSVLDDLRGYGLTIDGRPPAVTVIVGGRPVSVEVFEDVSGLTLRATVEALGAPHLPAGLPTNILGEATLAVGAASLTGTRTLSGVAGPVAYEAVYDLAKSLVRLARVAEQWAAVADLPAPAVAAKPGPPPPGPPPTQPGAPPAGPPPARPVAAPAAAAPAVRWWGSVRVATPIVSGDASRTPVGTLQPGQWYGVLDEQGGWLLVDDGAGRQGWIGVAQLQRGG